MSHEPTPEQAQRRDHLADVLDEYRASSYMLQRAEMGVYDPFSSKRANPHGCNLTSHARKDGLPDEFIQRVMSGEFDAPG
jgi:hypothetical protein